MHLSSFIPSTKKTTQGPNKKHKQSKKQPDTLNSDDKDKAEALHAFRTITTMLSLIESPTSSGKDTTGDESNSRTSRSALSLLNALAAIVSREHGIAAAVAAKDDGSGNIQVLTSITYFNHDKRPLIAPQQSSIASTIKGFFITQNPRYAMDEGLVISDSETVVRTQHLNDHADKGSGSELLTTFLTYAW